MAIPSTPSPSTPKTASHHASLGHPRHGPGRAGSLPERQARRRPVIKDGFYYDFQVDQPFTPNDLKDIEKRMQRIIKSSQSFRRRSVTEEEALKEEADQPLRSN